MQGSLRRRHALKPNRIGRPGRVAQWESARFTREAAGGRGSPGFRRPSGFSALRPSSDTVGLRATCRGLGSGMELLPKWPLSSFYVASSWIVDPQALAFAFLAQTRREEAQSRRPSEPTSLGS